MAMPTNAYKNVETETRPQNELEARALIKTASVMNYIKENWEDRKGELNSALEMNRKLWTILTGNINDADNPLPLETKQNVANLAYFIFKRTIQIMADPKPNALDILISINMNIARGLHETSTESEGGVPQAQQPDSGNTNQTA